MSQTNFQIYHLKTPAENHAKATQLEATSLVLVSLSAAYGRHLYNAKLLLNPLLSFKSIAAKVD